MIVDLYNNGTPALTLADEYGLQNSLIYKWIKIYNNDTNHNVDETIKLKKKVKDLEKQLNQKEMEVDILKKASAIFIQTKDKE